ncbi:unnamed protein product, partial [marine sediment metagenome]
MSEMMVSQLLAEQKNINTKDNYNYSLGQTNGSSAPDLIFIHKSRPFLNNSQTVEVTAPELYTVEKQGFPSIKLNSVKLMLGKIKRCIKGYWVEAFCKECKNPVIVDEKPLIVRRFCHNKY